MPPSWTVWKLSSNFTVLKKVVKKCNIFAIIGRTHTHPTHLYNFEWPWTILKWLAKLLQFPSSTLSWLATNPCHTFLESSFQHLSNICLAHTPCPRKRDRQYFGHNFDKFNLYSRNFCKEYQEYHEDNGRLLTQQKRASPNHSPCELDSRNVLQSTTDNCN